MTKIPTLYSDYRECMLDLDIYGKIVATPQQSIQELTETLFEEFQRRKPMPTLEYKRYELSRLVNPDFRIAYNKELELQDNERLLDLQSDLEASFENIDFEDLTSLIPTTKELFSYENHITDDMRSEIISKYDLSTGEAFKPGVNQTENIVGSVSEDDSLTLTEEKINQLGVDESEADITMAEDPMEVVKFENNSKEVKYEIEDDEVTLDDDYSAEDDTAPDSDLEDSESADYDSDEDESSDYDDYDSEDEDEDDEYETETESDDLDTQETDEDYDDYDSESEEDSDDEDYSSDSDDEDYSSDSDDEGYSSDSDDEDYSSDSEEKDSDDDDYDDYDSDSEEDSDDYDDYDSEDTEIESEEYNKDDSESEEDYDDYGESEDEPPDEVKIHGVAEKSIDLDDDDFDVSSFIDSVQDEPVTKQSEYIVDKVVETPITPLEVQSSNRPQSEIIDRASEPTEIRAFLRKHPRCEYDFALKYFTKKQINDAIKIGKIIKKGNILKI